MLYLKEDNVEQQQSLLVLLISILWTQEKLFLPRKSTQALSSIHLNDLFKRKRRTEGLLY